MTTSNPDLDTLIASTARAADYLDAWDAARKNGTKKPDIADYDLNPDQMIQTHLRDLAKALTDLRTERDAALATIEKAAGLWLRDSGYADCGNDMANILFDHPMSALADRDARILEEEDVEELAHLIASDGQMIGEARHMVRKVIEALEERRAASCRREASPQERRGAQK